MKRCPYAAMIIAILVAILFSTQFAGAARAAVAPGAGAGSAGGPGASVDARISPAPVTADGIPRTMGALRSPSEAKTRMLAHSDSMSALSALPAARDLTISNLPVGSQGSQSSCVGWAVGYYYKTYQEAREHGWDVSKAGRDFSPSWVYNQICGGRDEGATFGKAFQLLKDEGAVDISEFPYSADDWTTQPDSRDRQAAKPYRIADYAALWYDTGGSDVNLIKARIASGQPVVLGIPVYNSFYSCSGDWVSTPAAGESKYGDHAVCAVGYDDRAGGGKGGIKIANSWGGNWGDKGYTYLSYSFISAYCWEAWVTTDRASDTPVIRGMSPTTGRAGSQVVVSGDNFGANRGASAVRFMAGTGGGGLATAAGTVTYWSNTSIRVSAPAGVTDGSVSACNFAGERSNGEAFHVQLSLSSIEPSVAKSGDIVSIRGAGLGETAGRLKMGSTQLQLLSWNDGEIKFKAPSSPCSGAVSAYADGLASNPLQFSVVGAVWYLAEGSTGPGFAEYLCLGNPNNAAATANVTYFFSDGTTKDASYSVPAAGRTTVNINSEVGPDKEVSIRVLSETANLVAERPMYFNYQGVWTGGSDAVGATAPDNNWYFAEGTTLSGFDEYITVLNPTDSPANLTFKYMVEGSGEQDFPGSVRAHSRATFSTRNQIGDGRNASLHLSSDHAVVAERPMYFNYHGAWTGGHNVVGANAPSNTWYFAEGTTRSGFEEWLCLQNPGDSPITVNARYLLGPGQGDPISNTYTVPAKQRLTVSVNAEVGPEKDASIQLTSTGRFIAERPMYFDYQNVLTGGHDVLGVKTPAKNWYFAEGYTGANFAEWLCVQNPNAKDATLQVTYYPASGLPMTKPWTVAANTRLTIDVNQDAGPNLEISAKVTSSQPVIVERPMYFNYNGAWTGGHDVVGFVPE